MTRVLFWILNFKCLGSVVLSETEIVFWEYVLASSPPSRFLRSGSIHLQWFCSMNAALWTASHYYPSWTNTFLSLFRFSRLLSLYRIWRQIFETFWRKTRRFDWVVYNDRQVWIQAIASFFNLFDAKGSSADLGGTVDQGSNIAWSKFCKSWRSQKLWRDFEHIQYRLSGLHDFMDVLLTPWFIIGIRCW